MCRAGVFGGLGAGGRSRRSRRAAAEVLAKSARAVQAWHSANARPALPALFAKRARGGARCSGSLRRADEKVDVGALNGSGNTKGSGRINYYAPTESSCKTSRGRGRPA